MFSSNEHKISVICLQETWLAADSDTSLFQLDGYNLIHKAKSYSAHGDVAIYLHKDYEYEIINTHSGSNIWDGIFTKITINYNNIKKKIILGNTYRPPRPTVENILTYIQELNQIMNNLRNYKNVIITEDFNLDLLKFRVNNNINEYLDFMISNSYFPKITLPTRLTNRQGTLIDNFFVKMTENFGGTTSGILLNQISDHLPYFITLDYLHSSKPTHRHIKLSSSNPESLQNFKTELQNELIQYRLNTLLENPNESYDNFNEIIKQLINKYFPVKYVKFKKYKHKRSKWISKSILRSILYKDKLYVKLKATPVNSDQFQGTLTNFRTYTRILRQTINLAKKKYYHNCFNKFKCDMKKTWSTINEVLNKTKMKKDFPDYFEINGMNVSNKKIIANEFNKYFIDIGPSLAQNTHQPAGRSYKDYLLNALPSNFEFKAVTVETIIKVIDSLKPKTSSSLDKISNKLLKYVKSELAPPLTSIFNQSIQQGIFPDLMKQAKVIPIYK